MPSQHEMFFGADTFNRVSFLREDANFINQALQHDSTRFVLLNSANNNAVCTHPASPDAIYYSRYSEIKALVDSIAVQNQKEDVEINNNKFVFLGLDQNEQAAQPFKYKQYEGVPYFAIDTVAQQSILSELNLNQIYKRDDIFGLSVWDSSVFSHASMYLDWLNRNRFCAGCGSPTIPIHAGTKLKCSSTGKCPVKDARVSNVSFPRTDCVVITAITNYKHDKILLGRGKRFPDKNMYSTIAGFMEPSETIEVASIREAWEETGVSVSKLDIVKSQPWPYPANLMIGCVGYVEFNNNDEIINLGHDPELLDAQWFDIKLIKSMLYDGVKSDLLQLPPSTAIANHLIRYVVEKYDESQTKL